MAVRLFFDVLAPRHVEPGGVAAYEEQRAGYRSGKDFGVEKYK
jgi:hypothetical protein